MTQRPPTLLVKEKLQGAEVYPAVERMKETKRCMLLGGVRLELDSLSVG